MSTIDDMRSPKDNVCFRRLRKARRVFLETYVAYGFRVNDKHAF